MCCADFRKLLEKMEEEICSVPRIVLEDLLRKETNLLEGGQRKLQEKFAEKEKSLDEQKVNLTERETNVLLVTSGNQNRLGILERMIETAPPLLRLVFFLDIKTYLFGY